MTQLLLLMSPRKLNTSPTSIDDKDYLKLHLVKPPVKKIDLVFPLGLTVTARNLKGVTIKDALDAIYKQFKKKVILQQIVEMAVRPVRHANANMPQSDDELEQPYLAGFEWDKDECWTRLIIHQKKESTAAQQPGKKSKKKKDT